MKYGLLGARLDYSYSKKIHEQYLNIENYELKSLDESAFRSFMNNKDFKGINITNPYKKIAMEYCDCVDPKAKEIGCINTIVNDNNKLIGYNTDYYGMKNLINRIPIDITRCTVAILGTGATSNTAEIVAKDLNAFKIIKISRADKNYLSYNKFKKLYRDEPIFIINTTPVGTYPNIDDTPIDLNDFSNVWGVVDVVYNPIRSHLVQQAKDLGILADGGLRMLISQAVKANELFLGKKNYINAEDIYQKFIKSIENHIFIGMPGSGKTLVSKIVEHNTHKPCYHIDDIIETKENKSILQIFKDDGEDKFRVIECDVVKLLAPNTGVIIDCGGGVILNPINMFRLKQNGKINFIYRDLEDIIPTYNRPTALTYDMIKQKWEERSSLYYRYADRVINASCFIADLHELLQKDFE